MISLTRRLSLGVLIAGLTKMLLLAQGSVLLFDHAFRSYLGERLQVEAEGIVALALDEKGEPRAGTPQSVLPYQHVYSGMYYTLRVDYGPIQRSRSLWDHEISEQQLGLGPDLIPGPENQQLLVWRQQYHRGLHRIDVTTALDYTPVTRRLEWLRFSIWGLGGLMALCLVMIQRQVIHYSLKPFRALRDELRRFNAGHQMTLTTPMPVEIAPVVNELNHQLERIEKVLQRSRDGIANLSHALKTPLAVMESLLTHRELKQHPELRQQLHNRLDDIHRLVERELQRARLDTREELHAARFTPDIDLPPLLDTLRMLYAHVAFSVVPESHPALPWDREDILEVLGNLLDNAGKWANGQARLSFVDGLETLTIQVEDDGPGIQAQLREDVLQRGTRLDEQVNGHGLGLGIVEQIVSYHGGQLTLGTSPLGGLSVTLNLPWPTSNA